MAVQRDSITVVPPDGETVVVDILDADVSLGTVHAERSRTRTLTLPLTITERTSFYVPVGSGPYDVSVKLGGHEIAGAGGAPVTVSSFPAEIHARVDAAELGSVAGSGGSSAVGVGDYALWTHSGSGLSAVDYTSGGDLAAAGASISLDDSSGWITTWGSPLPKVNTDGLYAIDVAAEAPAVFSLHISVLDDEGNEPNWMPPSSRVANAVGNGSGTFSARDSATYYLTAGTHVDLSLGIGAAASFLWITVRKVG